MHQVMINGIQSHVVSSNDRGLQFGDGLFETMKCIDGKILYWKKHYQRLNQGCISLNIESFEEAILLSDIRQLVGGDDNCVIKVIITRGQSERGYAAPRNITSTRIVQRSELPDYPGSYYEQGIVTGFCSHPLSVNPALAGVKHLNRLDNVIARQQLDKHCQEGIMFDIDENVIEGIMSNLFIVKHGELMTPELSRCGIDGITRKNILEIAAALNIATQIKTLSKDDILDADEIFFCNSLIDIWPVRQLEDKQFDTHHLTNILLDALRRHGESHATAIC